MSKRDVLLASSAFIVAALLDVKQAEENYEDELERRKVDESLNVTGSKRHESLPNYESPTKRFKSDSRIHNKNTNINKLLSQPDDELLIFVKSILSQVKTLPKPLCSSLLKEIEKLTDRKMKSFNVNKDDGVFEEVFVKSEIEIHEPPVKVKEEIID